MRRRDRWLSRSSDAFWGLGIYIQALMITSFVALVIALIIMGWKALF